MKEREDAMKVLATALGKRSAEADRAEKGIDQRKAGLDRIEKDLGAAKEGLTAENRKLAEARKATDRSKAEIGRRLKELESQAGLIESGEEEAVELKTKAMSLLKSAEKAADEKSRELKERVQEEDARLEAERVKVEKAARAYEDLDERERRLETATAEFEARTKALDQREQKLKDEVAGIARERAETKAIWKNLEADRKRGSRKEATIDCLVSRRLGRASRMYGGRGRCSRRAARRSGS